MENITKKIKRLKLFVSVNALLGNIFLLGALAAKNTEDSISMLVLAVCCFILYSMAKRNVSQIISKVNV